MAFPLSFFFWLSPFFGFRFHALKQTEGGQTEEETK